MAGDGQIESGSGLSSSSERCVILLIHAGVIHAIKAVKGLLYLEMPYIVFGGVL